MPVLRAVNVQDFSGPKKGRSGFFIFGDEIRPEVAEKERKAREKSGGEKFSVAILAKAIGQRWKETPEEDKLKYNKLAEKETAEYKKAREKWEQTEDFQKWKNAAANYKKQKSDKKARAEVKSLGMPKRSAQPMMLFSSSIKDEITELIKTFPKAEQSMAQRQKILKEKWSALPEAKKKIWQVKHDEAKKKYDEEMTKFKETDEYKTFQDTMAKSKKRHKNATREDTEEPEAKKQKVSAMKSKESVSSMKSKASAASAKSK